MKKVLIYMRPTCPYCQRAMGLLQEKGVKDIEMVNISKFPERREEMINKAQGRTTVPQIFIGEEELHIGGCDDMFSLDYLGKLDELLGI